MPIVTISYQRGTEGAEIATGLAERLGYRHVGQDLIAEAASRVGLAEERLQHLDTTKPSFFERFDAETRRHIAVLEMLFLEFAAADDVVLVGGGGQWLLRQVPHGLRVRVIAPLEARVTAMLERLATTGEPSMDRRPVLRMLAHDDAARAGRMRYLFDVDIADPALYDVTLNQEGLTRDGAVEALATLAQRGELATTEAGIRLIEDRLLAATVRVALTSHPTTRAHQVAVDATGGVVTLEATDDALGPATVVARDAAGVRDVKTRRLEYPSFIA